MEFEKPHRSGTSSSSELFICFTSRPSFSSSSSMKMSSKPILSPGRNDRYREPTLSFSSSISRRHGNSMRNGGQSSPMFKKRGCGFENVEPTSPKVTCIGQVRVKTKKQGKKMMSLRRKEQHLDTQKKDGECLPQRNQKWVHLPLTICEALSCFLPCGGRGSSCSSRERGVKRRTMSSSCGAVFAKWLMALQEGEEGKRDIRVIVGEEEKNEKGEVFDEIEKGELKLKEESIGGGYEEERFSICIPPKNALLLMRCRSEPLRMSALANRFWESPVQDEDSEEEEDEDSEEDDVEENQEMKLDIEEEHEKNELSPQWSENVNSIKEETPLEEEEELVSAEVVQEDESSVIEETPLEVEWGLAELFDELEDPMSEEENPPMELVSVNEENPLKEQCDSAEVVEEQEEDTVKQETPFEHEEVQEEEEVESLETKIEEDLALEEKETESQQKQERESTVLPDCLLMMLCEPKLSMEVSKETWVCSTDYTQRRSQKQEMQINGRDETEDIKKCNPVQQQSQQSSISPAAASMATVIEQKLMNAVAYEPFVLTRCKSEPLRTSAKLVPEACFWKNRQLEPAHGVGF